MIELLRYIIQNLVDKPDAVRIHQVPAASLLMYEIYLDQADYGKVVGRNGKNIGAIRTVMTAVAAKNGSRINIEVIE